MVGPVFGCPQGLQPVVEQPSQGATGTPRRQLHLEEHRRSVRAGRPSAQVGHPRVQRSRPFVHRLRLHGDHPRARLVRLSERQHDARRLHVPPSRVSRGAVGVPPPALSAVLGRQHAIRSGAVPRGLGLPLRGLWLQGYAPELQPDLLRPRHVSVSGQALHRKLQLRLRVDDASGRW